jgi:hypothetical protein
MPTPEHPERGGRYYLVDDVHVPAEQVEATGDPFGVFTPPAPAVPAADSADPSTEEEI